MKPLVPLRAGLLLGVPPLLAMLVLFAVYAADSFACGSIGTAALAAMVLIGSGLLGAFAVASRRPQIPGVPDILLLLCFISAVAIVWIAIPLAVLRPCAA